MTKRHVAVGVWLLAVCVVWAGGVSPAYQPSAAVPPGRASQDSASTKPSKDDAEKVERAKLVGLWKGFTVEGKGENPNRGPVKLELTVTRDTMHGIQIKGDRRIDHGEGKYILDLTTDPPRLDGVQVKERGRKREYIGIYKLEGDTLTWCVTPKKIRPKTFETKKGQFLLILRKAKERPKSHVGGSKTHF